MELTPTNEVGNEEIKKSTVEFTDNPEKLREAKFHIVDYQHQLIKIKHRI